MPSPCQRGPRVVAFVWITLNLLAAAAPRIPRRQRKKAPRSRWTSSPITCCWTSRWRRRTNWGRWSLSTSSGSPPGSVSLPRCFPVKLGSKLVWGFLKPSAWCIDSNSRCCSQDWISGSCIHHLSDSNLKAIDVVPLQRLNVLPPWIFVCLRHSENEPAVTRQSHLRGRLPHIPAHQLDSSYSWRLFKTDLWNKVLCQGLFTLGLRKPVFLDHWKLGELLQSLVKDLVCEMCAFACFPPQVPFQDTAKYIQSFRLQNLQPDTVYIIQVCCQYYKDGQYWSDWSSNVTKRTPEDRESPHQIIVPTGKDLTFETMLTKDFVWTPAWTFSCFCSSAMSYCSLVCTDKMFCPFPSSWYDFFTFFFGFSGPTSKPDLWRIISNVDGAHERRVQFICKVNTQTSFCLTQQQNNHKYLKIPKSISVGLSNHYVFLNYD